MKVRFFLAAIGIAYSSVSLGAGNTFYEKISSIESRYSGYHAIFMKSPVAQVTQNTLTAEGCVLSDRAILLESEPAAKAEFAMILTALALDKSVTIRVDGCTVIDPLQPQYTAPKIVKVQIYSANM
jgi:hypothetical protein